MITRFVINIPIMKKLALLLLPILSLLLLQSCTFTTTNHYHKDKTISVLSELDATEFMQAMKSMGGDSLSQEKAFGAIKLPKEWQSMYDIELADGKVTKDPDSIKLLQRVFVKGNFKDEDFSGFSLKMDHAKESEINAFYNSLEKDKMASNLSIPSYSTWDGKQLEIDTQKLLKPKNVTAKEDDNALNGMLDMIDLKLKNILVFDTKIKSIKGKHDWIKQIDDKTILIEYDNKSASDANYKFKHNDAKILIVTQ